MCTSVVVVCGLCGKSVKDFFYKVHTNEGDKALCLECAGANTIQQLSDIGFIDAPEEIVDEPVFSVNNPESLLYPKKALEAMRGDAGMESAFTSATEGSLEEPF